MTPTEHEQKCIDEVQRIMSIHGLSPVLTALRRRIGVSGTDRMVAAIRELTEAYEWARKPMSKLEDIAYQKHLKQMDGEPGTPDDPDYKHDSRPID